MSKIKTSRNRKTCSVFGCMNSNLQNPDMAFFSLPSDPQRLTSWLSLMDRVDLANKPERHYRVCETHFDRGCILVTSNRKVLKKNALPSLRLPVAARLHKGVQTPGMLLPVVFTLKPGGVRDAADLLNAADGSEDPQVYCEGGTAARGRGELLDAAGNTVGRIHEGFQCNLCNADILGFRYTCVQCADYDMCCACEAAGAHAAHYVLRVPGPRPYAETQAVLSRIRRQLQRPDNAALSDSLKFEIKLEADDPLDPGPDPLQQAERQDKDEARPQTEIRTSLETFEPVHIEDLKRKENHGTTETGKQANIQKHTGNNENTTAAQQLFVHELANERHKRQYVEQPNDDEVPLNRLYKELSTDNMPEKRQFLELPTNLPQERHYTELPAPSTRQYTIDRPAEHMPEKRQIEQAKDASEKRPHWEQFRYDASHMDRAFSEANPPQNSEDPGAFVVEVYTHQSSGENNTHATGNTVTKKVHSKKVKMASGTSESETRSNT